MGEDSLARFKEKYAEWQVWLGSDDQNSILQQVFHMIWDAGVFRVVLKARTLAGKTRDGKLALNAPVHSLLDRCFFQSQAATIRRLTDTERRAGKHEVFSLMRLVCDMEQNSSLFTRRNLFAAIGKVPYDAREMVEKERQYVEEHEKAGEMFFVPTEFDATPTLEFHADLDLLCGAQAGSRTENDRVAPEVFKVLKRKLEACRELKVYVDKFIAHAASPDSRRTQLCDESRITWDHLWEAHRNICQVVHFLGVNLLGRKSYGFLPLPHGAISYLMDRPLAERTHLPALEKVWDEFMKETWKWQKWDAGKMVEEMTRLA